MSGFSLVPNALWDDTRLSQKAKTVYAALIRHIDVKGTCFPSIALLAKEAACSKDSVRKAITELEAREFLTVQGQTSSRHPGQTSNLYRLNLRVHEGVVLSEGVAHSEGGSSSQQGGQSLTARGPLAETDTKETQGTEPKEGNSWKETDAPLSAAGLSTFDLYLLSMGSYVDMSVPYDAAEWDDNLIRSEVAWIDALDPWSLSNVYMDQCWPRLSDDARAYVEARLSAWDPDAELADITAVQA